MVLLPPLSPTAVAPAPAVVAVVAVLAVVAVMAAAVVAVTMMVATMVAAVVVMASRCCVVRGQCPRRAAYSPSPIAAGMARCCVGAPTQAASSSPGRQPHCRYHAIENGEGGRGNTCESQTGSQWHSTD